MKGPGNRLKFVIRRAWQCPLCSQRVVTSGSVVSRACSCRPPDDRQGPVWMLLVKDPLRTGRQDVQP